MRRAHKPYVLLCVLLLLLTTVILMNWHQITLLKGLPPGLDPDLQHPHSH